MKPHWLKRIAIENANARLNAESELCPTPNRINAILIGVSRCRCGNCHFNRAIRRGLLRGTTRKSISPEKVANPRLSPSALVEIAGVMKAGAYILSVAVILAGPMVALEEASSPKTDAVVTVAFRPPVRLARSPETISSTQNANVPPTPKQTSSGRRLVNVPEILSIPPPARPAPPTNLRISP